ncbi:MAG: hypothetical protein D6722_23195, partial [Bacteroidetes bacterium]
EYYITPEYLSRMKARARHWSTEFLKTQARLFRKTLPDYPELTDLIEAELHRRNLNLLLRSIRKKPDASLPALLQKYRNVPDYAEVIRTEMEIRSGKARLSDPTKGKGSRLILD